MVLKIPKKDIQSPMPLRGATTQIEFFLMSIIVNVSHA
jgi:hypothetical protein